MVTEYHQLKDYVILGVCTQQALEPSGVNSIHEHTYVHMVCISQIQSPA